MRVLIEIQIKTDRQADRNWFGSKACPLYAMWKLTWHDALLHKLLSSSPLLQTELEDCGRAETPRSRSNVRSSEPNPSTQLTTIAGFKRETCQTSNKTFPIITVPQCGKPCSPPQISYSLPVWCTVVQQLYSNIVIGWEPTQWQSTSLRGTQIHRKFNDIMTAVIIMKGK